MPFAPELSFSISKFCVITLCILTNYFLPLESRLMPDTANFGRISANIWIRPIYISASCILLPFRQNGLLKIGPVSTQRFIFDTLRAKHHDIFRFHTVLLIYILKKTPLPFIKQPTDCLQHNNKGVFYTCWEKCKNIKTEEKEQKKGAEKRKNRKAEKRRNGRGKGKRKNYKPSGKRIPVAEFPWHKHCGEEEKRRNRK